MGCSRQRRRGSRRHTRRRPVGAPARLNHPGGWRRALPWRRHPWRHRRRGWRQAERRLRDWRRGAQERNHVALAARFEALLHRSPDERNILLHLRHTHDELQRVVRFAHALSLSSKTEISTNLHLVVPRIEFASNLERRNETRRDKVRLHLEKLFLREENAVEVCVVSEDRNEEFGYELARDDGKLLRRLLDAS